MLTSKFDLYRAEWLDLVFDKRNKAYGAYELRQHYAKNTISAMAITFLATGVLFGAALIFRSAPVMPDHHIIVHLTQVAPPVAPPKKQEPLPPVKRTQAPPPQVATTIFVPPVVVDETQHHVETPPAIINIQGQIGQTTVKGPVTEGPPVNVPGDGGPPNPAPDVSIHNIAGLDVMPEPVGGEAAWAKFLNKNLNYPAEEREQGISGRVIMSFVIEKDGHLTDIKVVRSAGDDFDKEALRVLKLAKAWKPGMQNGQPVRVSYMIPISFQISSDSE
jgi:protein TonB